ncbi:MAG TPA: cytochrome c3 family protein [Kofleriaceae bacterium]|nr:cytochrome c3 family protein [Kofleriaceae bacterium]
MTARALALVVLAVLVSRVAFGDGFDHTLHARDVDVSGGDAIACAHCHAIDAAGKLVGRPDHAACFGSCHGAPPTKATKLAKADGDRGRVCASCHGDAGKLAVPYPPYTIEQDFGVALGHKQHAAATCTQCHDLGAKPAPHARCTSCHDGTKATSMRECSTCHIAAVGKPHPPELRPLQDSIASIFSHGSHAKRSQAGRDCMTCHAAIARTDDAELPRPTVADCATCHDGKQAFATTVACTRCHAAPSKAEPFDVARPEARFSHAGPHAQLVAGQPCASCHALDKTGEAMAPGHAQCTGCHDHAVDFGARSPKICGACHLATEPWRHLAADRPPPDESELGATLDHDKHPGDCTSCHRLRTKAAELQLPRGHAACAGCHQVTPPTLDDCKGCHALGRVAARLATRAADPWSVRATFEHAAHQPARCTSCHTDLHGADVTLMAAPTKPTCATCHDGTTAFSLTGTTCRKCHSQ